MKIRVEVHHFFHGVDNDILNNIYTYTKLIHQQNQKIMADIQTWEAALVKIDTATTQIAESVTRIADRMTTLEDTIKNMGLSSEQEATLLSRTEGIGDSLTNLATTLEQIGKTPENPVPVEPGTGENGGSL